MAKKIVKAAAVSKVKLAGKIQPVAKPVLKKVSFKFKIKPSPVVFSRKVKLKSADVINLKVIRNPGHYTRIEQISDATGSNDNNWNCSIQRWSADVIRPEPVVLNTKIDEIYPGAIFAYESIDNGTYKRLPYDRKPLNVLINRNQASVATVSVNNPSAASIAQAISNIRGSLIGGGAAVTFGESFEVLSEEDLFMRTGGSGYYLGFGGNHSIDFTSNSKSHRFYIKLYQEYYSILIDDTHNEPSDFFVMAGENNSSADALDPDKVNPDWVVVNAVKYGRALNLMFESDESFSSYGIDVHAYANFLVAGASVDFSMRQQSFLKRTSVRLVAYGGNPGLTGQILTAGNQAELKKAINNYFAGSMDEVPIAYSLSTLDGENIGVHLTAEFTSRQCAPAAEKFEVLWKSVHCASADDASGDEEITACLRIRAFEGNGKEIPDMEKKNKAILEAEKMRKETGFKFPIPWTFTKGTRQHPLQLGFKETREIDQRIIFKVPKSDLNARVGIRADVLEYDSTSADDDFADDHKSYKFSETGNKKEVKLVCDHEGSRIEFHLEIRPVYD